MPCKVFCFERMFIEYLSISEAPGKIDEINLVVNLRKATLLRNNDHRKEQKRTTTIKNKINTNTIIYLVSARKN